MKTITAIFFMLFLTNSHAEEIIYAGQDTPQNTTKLYFQSLKYGNVKKFKSTIHASDKLVNAMSKMVLLAKVLFDYDKAVKTKYKDDTSVQALINNMTGLEQFEKQSKNLKVKINGNKAVSIPQEKREVAVNFIKSNGKWQFDFSIMENSPQGSLMPLAFEKAMPKIITHIKNQEKIILTTDRDPKEITQSLPDFFKKTIQASVMEVLKEQENANPPTKSPNIPNKPKEAARRVIDITVLVDSYVYLGIKKDLNKIHKDLEKIVAMIGKEVTINIKISTHAKHKSLVPLLDRMNKVGIKNFNIYSLKEP